MPAKDPVVKNWYNFWHYILLGFDETQSLELLGFVCNGYYLRIIMILDFVFNWALEK